MTNERKQKIPNRGNARAAQNRKLRRDALREELKAREYLRQIEEIDQKLQEDEWSANLQALKLRADLQFRRLAKVLPDVKSSSERVSVEGMTGSLTEMGERIIEAMGSGDLSTDAGTAMLSAMASLVRVIEADELAKRVAALEAKHGKS